MNKSNLKINIPLKVQWDGISIVNYKGEINEFHTFKRIVNSIESNDEENTIEIHSSELEEFLVGAEYQNEASSEIKVPSDDLLYYRATYNNNVKGAWKLTEEEVNLETNSHLYSVKLNLTRIEIVKIKRSVVAETAKEFGVSIGDALSTI